jgi:peptidoglycan/LPS O-acetylase OafA/YrhL
MKRVECLDGLRGLAALWVLLGHAMILTGFRLPLVSQPDLGVDLFILLSGFLMAFQYRLRSAFEDWQRPSIWGAFWVRRFFRIAPLFYVLLAAALIAGPAIYADRVAIDTFLGQSLQPPERYLDHGPANIVAHLSFVFGLLPSYAYRTALPDWSLGLEMQFYAVFPFLVLLTRRVGWVWGAIAIGAAGALTALAANRAGLVYPMPAFLPLKLHLFLCGMLIAADHRGRRSQLLLHLAVAMLLASLPFGGARDLLHLAVRELLVVTFFGLVHLGDRGVVGMASRLLGSKPFHWLGELSYGTYLIHLLILQPVAAWAIAEFGRGIGAPVRFALVVLIVAPITYGIAFVTYKLVELPGQALGKALLRRATHNRQRARQVVVEELAAP